MDLNSFVNVRLTSRFANNKWYFLKIFLFNLYRFTATIPEDFSHKSSDIRGLNAELIEYFKNILGVINNKYQ